MSFDNQASTWDNDPKKVARAKAFAKEITDFLKPYDDLTTIEFGCGTGLLSFEMKDFFKKVTLVDNSSGMIEVLKTKIQQYNIDHFYPVFADIINDDINLEKHNVLYMLMAFHHIKDSHKAIEKFKNLLCTDGYLCIADLVKEDGSFHNHVANFDGHNGFDKDELLKMMEDHGFEVVFYKEVFEIEKEVGSMNKKFPLFLMIAKKK